jgi:hypothetical protein
LFTYLSFAGFARKEAAIPEQFGWSMPWLMFFALVVVAVLVGFGQLVSLPTIYQSIELQYNSKSVLHYGTKNHN